MNRVSGIVGVLAILPATLLPALDDDFGGFSDLRLGFHAAGIGYEVEYLGVTDAGGYDLSTRLALDWVASLGLRPGSGGLLIGLGFNWGYRRGGLDNGAEFTIQDWTIHAGLGWGWPLGDKVQFELLPYAGFGRGYMIMDPPIPGFDEPQKGNAPIWEFGVMSNLVWTLDSSMQLGLTFGFFFSRFEIRDETADIVFDWDMSNPTIALIWGARL